MSYRERYEQWLNSPALSQEEKAEPRALPMMKKRSSPASLPLWSSAPPTPGAPCAWACIR